MDERDWRDRRERRGSARYAELHRTQRPSRATATASRTCVLPSPPPPQPDPQPPPAACARAVRVETASPPQRATPVTRDVVPASRERADHVPPTDFRITVVEVRAAREGDGSALDRVLRAMRPVLLRYAARRVRRAGGSTDLAEDIVQDTLIRVATSVGRCTAETPGGLFAWALAIARRAILELHRSPPLELSAARAPLELVDATRGGTLACDALGASPLTDRRADEPIAEAVHSPCHASLSDHHAQLDVRMHVGIDERVGGFIEIGVAVGLQASAAPEGDAQNAAILERRVETGADTSDIAHAWEEEARILLTRLVMRHLAELPVDVQQIVWAHVVEGRPWSAVAADRATTLSAAKRRFQRAQRRVRQATLADIARLPPCERDRLLRTAGHSPTSETPCQE